MLIGEIAERNARRFPDKTAVVFEGKSFSFKEFNNRVNSISNAFQGMGLSGKNKVAVLLDNCNEYIELYFSLAKIGIPIVPLNWRLSPNELAYILNNCEAETIVVGDNYFQLINDIRPKLIAIENVIKVSDKRDNGLNYENLLLKYPSNEPKPSNMVKRDDMFILLYTSGSTGLPKGVMITHDNMIANTVNILLCENIKHNDVLLYVLPLFHVSVWSIISHFYVGSAVVLLRRFDNNVFLDTIGKEKITHLHLVPSLIISVINSPSIKEYKLDSVRLISYGGSPMPLEVLKRAIEIFGNVFLQIYGLTEASTLVTYLPPEDHVVEGSGAKRLESVGREGVNIQLRVVREDGSDITRGTGEIGELIFKGDNAMKGYWKSEGLMDKTVKDGWLYTGDMGTMDEDGYVYLVDRKSDMIITGAENVYPAEVENVLYKHEAVLEAGVIGMPDEKWGEAVTAAVILKQGKKISKEELMEFCRSNIAKYKAPKSIVFVNELPKTPSGKVKRKVLREQLLEEVKKR